MSFAVIFYLFPLTFVNFLLKNIVKLRFTERCNVGFSVSNYKEYRKQYHETETFLLCNSYSLESHSFYNCK